MIQYIYYCLLFGKGAISRFDVLNCCSESLTVGWSKCLMLAVMLEHFFRLRFKGFPNNKNPPSAVFKQ